MDFYISSPILPKVILMNMRTREGVCIILYRKSDNGFEAFRGRTPRGDWKVVQGGKKEDESLEEAALRELEEETGIDPETVKKFERAGLEHRFTFQGDQKIEPYRGVQEVFIVKIPPETEISTNHEFVEHEFLPMDKIIDRISYDNLKKSVAKD